MRILRDAVVGLFIVAGLALCLLGALAQSQLDAMLAAFR